MKCGQTDCWSYRFWSIVRPGVVPDVLGGVEHTECQTSQEVSGGQETSYRAQLETCHTYKEKRLFSFSNLLCLTLQKIRNSLKLRNLIRRVPTVLLKKWEDMVMLIAGVGLVETGQVVEDHLPHSFLLLSVAHMGNGGPTEHSTCSTN